MGSMPNYLVTVGKLLSHPANIGITSVTQLTQVAFPIYVCGSAICVYSCVSALQCSMPSAQTFKPKFGDLQSKAITTVHENLLVVSDWTNKPYLVIMELDVIWGGCLCLWSRCRVQL